MFAGFERYIARVNERLEEVVGGLPGFSAELDAAIAYSALSPGKRVRGTLVLLVAEALGGRADDFLPVASALELVHAFSLVHDDLPALDDDDFRRGRATTHRVYGEAVALLAGDALVFLAFEELLGAGAIPGEAKASMARELARAAGAGGMTAGQAIDIALEGLVPEPPTHRRMYELKTGRLFGFALSAPAMALAPEAAGPLREAGTKMGVAFQVSDDLLEATGTFERLGKATDSDAKKRKATAVALYGLAGARALADRLYDEVAEELARVPGRWGRVLDLIRAVRERES